MFAATRENCVSPLPRTRKIQLRDTFLSCLVAGVLLCATTAHVAAQCVPAPDGLVTWWAGDGEATDSAGDLDGTAVGTTFASGFVTSGGGQAFSFDGIDDLVDFSAHASVLNFSPAATFEFWLSTTSDVGQVAYSISDGTTTRLIFGFGDGFTNTLTDELITVARVDGIDSYILAYTTPTRSELFDGSFHYIAISFDGSEVKIHLDGAPKTVSVGFGSNSGVYGGLPGASQVYLGAEDIGGGPVYVVDGIIDEFKTYNRALSDAEILAIFNAGAEGTCKTPTQKLQLLASQILALNLSNGISNALDAKLEAALNALDDLNSNNDVAAINSLNAFINAVEAQRDKKLSDEQANTLIDAAQAIIAAIESQM